MCDLVKNAIAKGYHLCFEKSSTYFKHPQGPFFVAKNKLNQNLKQ